MIIAQIICQTCKRDFTIRANVVKQRNRKYCGATCYHLAMRGAPGNNTGKSWRMSAAARLNMGKANFTGKSHSAATKATISKSRTGKGATENNGKWMGDNVGYRALHAWVSRKLGKPDTCVNCGKTGLSGRQIHWANISHQYYRLDDWIRLCAKCHKAYDLGRLTLTQAGG